MVYQDASPGILRAAYAQLQYQKLLHRSVDLPFKAKKGSSSLEVPERYREEQSVR